MATSFSLQKLEEQLKCPICLDNLKEPKGLLCFHSFCRVCLNELNTEEEGGHKKLRCPTCRQLSPLPQGGIDELPTAFHVNVLLELHQTLQQPRDDNIEEMYMCTLHGKLKEFYCLDCNILICSICVIRGHKGHECETITEAFELKKGNITSCLRQLKEWVEKISHSMESFDDETQDTHQQADTTKAEVCAIIDKLHQALEKKKIDLLDKVDAFHQSKVDQIAQRRERAETMLAQMKSCQEFVEEKLATAPKQHVLAVNTQMVHHMQALMAHIDTRKLKQVHSSLFFDCNSSCVASCEDIGRVSQVQYNKCSVVVTKSIVTLGECIELVINVAGVDGAPAILPANSSCFSITIDPLPALKYMDVNRVEGKGSIVIELKDCGPYKLSVSIKGKQLPGSPMLTRVLPPLGEKRNSLRFKIKLGHRPSGIVVFDDTKIAVTHPTDHCITLLEKNGTSDFIEKAMVSTNITSPAGIAVTGRNSSDTGNRFLIATCHHCICVFTLDGKFVKAVGTFGTSPLQFNSPSGIAVHPDGRIFICDSLNHRIQVLNSDFSYAHSFGSEGRKRGQFKQITDVAIDSSGMIYIIDQGKEQIIKFTPEGELVTSASCEKPLYACIDNWDILYITREYEVKNIGLFGQRLVPYALVSHSISIYSCKLALLGELYLSVDCPYEACATNISVDSYGQLYVCNRYDYSINIY